ncbi:hypothetical protein QGM71_02730 [Virgibacillus sp. C22-A2]|uniref:Uncharacterized protein n=1 Tax=Virgibacillus tibetensis TaxID=3042313 RepID=A0ABU6KB48_9BACI|nr:hypothetical protein [Virgibacillus sp. C22-A2]
MEIYLTKGDTGIGRRATLSNENGPVDLKDAEVRFLFGEHAIYPEKESETGRLLVVFDEVHTSKAQTFYASFKITFKDGRIETFPGAESTKIKIYVRE